MQRSADRPVRGPLRPLHFAPPLGSCIHWFRRTPCELKKLLGAILHLGRYTLPPGRRVRGPTQSSEARPNLSWAFALARATSMMRFLGGVGGKRDSMSCLVATEISLTACSNAASFDLDGFLKPLTLRTYCSDDAWISSSVVGGS